MLTSHDEDVIKIYIEEGLYPSMHLQEDRIEIVINEYPINVVVNELFDSCHCFDKYGLKNIHKYYNFFFGEWNPMKLIRWLIT